MDIDRAGSLDMAKAASKNLPGLDVLRAFAILFVLFSHGGSFGMLPDGGGFLIKRGWMGVDIFFGLSGYLIGKQLLSPWSKGLRPDYGRFFSRRLFRTVPAFLFVLVLYFSFPASHPGQTLQPFWHYLTFSMNIFTNQVRPRAFLHAWSLCVEEQFYLICPLVIALLARRPSLKKTLLAVGVVLLLGAFARAYTCLHVVVEPSLNASGALSVKAYLKHVYFVTWNRLDELLIGVALAAVQLFRPLWWQSACASPNRLLALGVIGMSLAVYMDTHQPSMLSTTFVFPILAVSIGLLVMSGTQDTSLLAKLAIPGTAALAASAYSLYLIHVIAYRIVLNPVSHLGGLSDWPKFGVAVLLSLFLGALLYMCVERPFLKLRDRLDARRSS